MNMRTDCLTVNHPLFSGYIYYLASEQCCDALAIAAVVDEPWKWTEDFNEWVDEHHIT